MSAKMSELPGESSDVDNLKAKKILTVLIVICIVLVIICAYFFFKNAQLDNKIRMLEDITR